MNKKTFQDVVPGKHSIRNVKIPSRRKSDITSAASEIDVEMEERPKFKHHIEIKKIVSATESPKEKDDVAQSEPLYTYTYDDGDSKQSSRKILYISIGVFILAIAFGISIFFKSASIKVTPRSQTAPVSATLSAEKNVTDNSLGFQVVTVSKDVQLEVPATGEKNVSTKARGTIIVYNNATANPQKLIATTRFQTSNGLVYRLIAPVTVPGKQTKSGKVVPGSTEALVEADQPGDSYNIALTDFNLPALKGNPKYAEIYARSKTPMSGGFVGMQKEVSSIELAKTNDLLEKQLRDTFNKDIISQIPANFVLYDKAITYKFSEPTQVKGAGQGALIQKKGTAMAIIFDETVLSREIAKRVDPGNQLPVKVLNLSSLVFSLTPGTTFDTANSTQLSFILSGDAHLVWTFDESKFKSELLGLNRDQAKIVGGTYPAIKEMRVETKPFWNRSIPSDSERVTIINSLSK